MLYCEAYRNADIGRVIYGGTRGTGTPTFWTEGYRTPTFQDENVKNFLSPALAEAICGD